MHPHLLQIDASNRADHFYLTEEHECYFFYEYAPRQGYSHSHGNQFISNLKKPVSKRGQAEYRFKEKAITNGAQMLRGALLMSTDLLLQATVTSVPPSKVRSDPAYDDRMSRLAALACFGTAADVRDIITQSESYDASHTVASGDRQKPHELTANYRLSLPAPRSTVIVIDDVLTTGAHFIAVRDTILSNYPATRVIGIFMARRVLPNVADVFGIA